MFLSAVKKALFLGPHPDDIEFGAGGTLAKLQKQGTEIHCGVFSRCIPSLPDGSYPDQLFDEFRTSMKVMGVPERNLFFHDFPVRRFPEHRQDILEILVQIGRQLRPDIVFCPMLNDVHQDHSTIAAETLRAFKFTSIMNYELVWNSFSVETSGFVALDQLEVDRKISALKCYRSQAGRKYMDPELITSMTRVRGMQCQTEHAEAFQIMRVIA